MLLARYTYRVPASSHNDNNDNNDVYETFTQLVALDGASQRAPASAKLVGGPIIGGVSCIQAKFVADRFDMMVVVYASSAGNAERTYSVRT